MQTVYPFFTSLVSNSETLQNMRTHLCHNKYIPVNASVRKI